MKQVAKFISTYTADVSGVCSALFELGGMTVMHDASGCNSTYNTHDEPRWYDTDSLVFISALTEMEAIMGDDEKLIRDVTDAALSLHPRFIALAGTPIPMLTGCDLEAAAALIEQRTGIPSFGFSTNGMHSYLSGASMAFDALARRMTVPDIPRSPLPSVNLLGVTPLDFSVCGSAESMRRWLEEHGFQLQSCWAMGSSLDQLQNAGAAWVNLVVSSCGLEAARTLQKKFGTPYVIGTPVGKEYANELAGRLRRATENSPAAPERSSGAGAKTVLIGESVTMTSLAEAIFREWHLPVRVISPLETPAGILRPGDTAVSCEEETEAALDGAETVIADPLFQPICRGRRFLPLPSEAFSGRIYRDQIPDLINQSIKQK